MHRVGCKKNQMKQSGIYRIELGNGWFYIGSTKNLILREKQHQRELKLGSHKNNIAQSCWNKYQVFEFVILENCVISNLISREQFYLDKHFHNPKNVNICRVAGSVMTGLTHSAESRKKMSNARQLRKPASIETREKMSASMKGRVFSASHCAKLSSAARGKIVSAETRAKLSKINIGKTHSAESRAKQSASQTGKKIKPRSTEQRLKQSKRQTGYKHSIEAKANMSAAQKLRREQEKLGRENGTIK